MNDNLDNIYGNMNIRCYNDQVKCSFLYSVINVYRFHNHSGRAKANKANFVTFQVFLTSNGLSWPFNAYRALFLSSLNLQSSQIFHKYSLICKNAEFCFNDGFCILATTVATALIWYQIKVQVIFYIPCSMFIISYVLQSPPSCT